MKDPAFPLPTPSATEPAKRTVSAAEHVPTELSPELTATLTALFGGRGNNTWGRSRGRRSSLSLT